MTTFSFRMGQSNIFNVSSCCTTVHNINNLFWLATSVFQDLLALDRESQICKNYKLYKRHSSIDALSVIHDFTKFHCFMQRIKDERAVAIITHEELNTYFILRNRKLASQDNYLRQSPIPIGQYQRFFLSLEGEAFEEEFKMAMLYIQVIQIWYRLPKFLWIIFRSMEYQNCLYKYQALQLI